MSIAIKAEGLSKAYQLGQIGTGTISRDIERWWAGMKGKEDPFLKIGEENDTGSISESNIVWSLKDISFEIEQGSAIGIIGRNGAGKSTLLKLLSRITSPTAGIIKVKGRIASLLEVGTGFHPELSGKENIYLNGAILGMRRKEIDRKLDEIIAFSGVEKYIDTPVKRYSSGMYVRLAFAVAAHLESETLIVDEVLAVGDAEFQKKCLGKMDSVSRNEGRTIIFVSHNMAAIKVLCNTVLVLDKGKLIANTDVNTGIRQYLQSNIAKDRSVVNNITGQNIDPVILWKGIEVLQQGEVLSEIQNDRPFSIAISYELKENIKGFRLFIDMADDRCTTICKSFFDEGNDTGTDMKAGIYTSVLHIPENLLIEGEYTITIFAGIHGIRVLNPVNGIPLTVSVMETGIIRRRRFEEDFKGLVTLPLNWVTVPKNNNT